MKALSRWPVFLLVFWCSGPLLLAAAPETQPADPDLLDLDRRYAAMLEQSGSFGDGGREVLEVAYAALRRGRSEGKWSLVGLEDLWAEAIKEGVGLFNKPAKRWGLTRGSETADLFGQNTVGPWQMTITNIRLIYGPQYGVDPDWTEWRVYEYCRDHPEIQAAMIADYIQESYEQHGRRGPYAIQRYFSLNAYLRCQIGQAAWDAPVLASNPSGDWTQISPAAKANTGFYAKQLLLGSRSNSRGLLYWLWVTEDTAAIRDTLRVWRDQPRLIWDFDRKRPLMTTEPGDYAIELDDLRYLPAIAACQRQIERLVVEVLSEPRSRPVLVTATAPADATLATASAPASPATRPEFEASLERLIP